MVERPFEGHLVEVHSLYNELLECTKVLHHGEQESSPTPEKIRVDIDGRRGLCHSWSDENRAYMVETFDGFFANVPEDHLREYYPESAQDGGFDVAWPRDSVSLGGVGKKLVDVTRSKGYCVVQMFLNEEDRERINAKAEGMTTWHRMKRELETAYLGYDCNTKVVTLGEGDSDEMVNGALSGLEDEITKTAELMAPFAEELGLLAYRRTKSFLRMSYADQADQEDITPEALVDMAESDEWSGDVEAYSTFVRTRSLCMTYLIENEGGVFWLYPKDALNSDPVNIPITKGKLVIFRHDLMDYSYQPIGRSLALQSWITGPLPDKPSRELMLNAGEGCVIVNPGLPQPSGPPAHVISLHTHFPGNAWNEYEWLGFFAGATDAGTPVPYLRWDTQIYYMEGDTATQVGKSYTKHGGFLECEQIGKFDNKFFGIPAEEAQTMIPSQRLVLECGHQALAKAGYNKQNLNGQDIGIWIGDIGPDWATMQIDWVRIFPDISGPMIAQHVHSAVTAARLHHTHGLTGPVSTYDTACSSALVAINAGHAFMFQDDPPSKGQAKALAMGINTLLGPAGYFMNCAGGNLSHLGRSFTFNRSADGYMRGEGVGSIYFTTDEKTNKFNNYEQRVGALIGTASAHDGRSASITAPNGPAQTALILQSLRFSEIKIGTLGIAECHGTGTALGDPIEVGAMQAVMRTRDFPILTVTTKSHIGHLEAAAGIAGITKCVMMVRYSNAPSNCHFHVLNPNIILEGYPCLIDSEMVDTGYSSGYCGVSSFGFGGANARADVYALADGGPRKTVKIRLPLPSDPRPIYESSDCFHLAGSWDAWSSMEEMEQNEVGEHIAFIALGAHQCEQFLIHVNSNDEEAIHPSGQMCGSSGQVLGPDEFFVGKTWCIDGRADGVPAGTIYKIVFRWSNFLKCISWAPCKSDSPVRPLGLDYEHKYFVVGSMTKDVFRQMPRADDVEGLFERRFRIGPRCQENFHIVCDGDKSRTIYPADPHDISRGLQGPDCFSEGRQFSVQGRQDNTFMVQLRVHGGKTTVTAVVASGGARTWTSLADVPQLTV